MEAKNNNRYYLVTSIVSYAKIYFNTTSIKHARQ